MAILRHTPDGKIVRVIEHWWSIPPQGERVLLTDSNYNSVLFSDYTGIRWAVLETAKLMPIHRKALTKELEIDPGVTLTDPYPEGYHAR